MPGYVLIKEFFEASITNMFENLLNECRRSKDGVDHSDLIRGQILGVRLAFSIDKMLDNYDANRKKLEEMKSKEKDNKGNN
jgi:hypothetical protein